MRRATTDFSRKDGVALHESIQNGCLQRFLQLPGGCLQQFFRRASRLRLSLDRLFFSANERGEASEIPYVHPARGIGQEPRAFFADSVHAAPGAVHQGGSAEVVERPCHAIYEHGLPSAGQHLLQAFVP